MIDQLRTYNALRAMVGPCDALRLASMDQQALLAGAYRTALQRQQPSQARRGGMPIQLDGPHINRKQRRKALLRAAVALLFALAFIVGLPMLSGVLYAQGIH